MTSYFAENAPGIVQLGIHISGPIIPERLRQQFEALDEERTKVLIAQEKVKVQELELEMLKRKAVAEVCPTWCFIIQCEKSASISFANT